MQQEIPQQIAEDTLRRARALLEQPGPDAKAVQGARESVQALAPTIGAAAVKDALRAMEGADRQLREHRLRELGDALASALKPLGLRLDVHVLKRQPRKRSAKPAAPQVAEQASAMMGGESAKPTPTATEEPGERSCFLGRRKAQ
ncbi:MAG: hypothetical protein V3W41_01620 [Planctomycetota bacterium]